VEEHSATDAVAPDLTPEGRRQDALKRRDIQAMILASAGPGTRAFTILKRVWTGAWNDGFIHAGNLAYMTLLALFPFFIAVAAIFAVIGEQGQLNASIDAVLTAVPPRVAQVIAPVARDIAAARQGWLLWVGGLFGLWTATSLIETIRDILHRAYGTPATHAFWHYRLFSTGVIFAAVSLLLIALSGQVMLSAVQEIVLALFPGLDLLVSEFVVTRLVSAGALFGSIYMLFVSLTPSQYQARRYPKWPGALLVTAWWILVTFALPRVLRTFFTYDLTYGSLAGVMIALFFFWLVGLGMVVGAELNAALAVSPEEQEVLSQAGRPSETNG
jgi:membrane protein